MFKQERGLWRKPAQEHLGAAAYAGHALRAQAQRVGEQRRGVGRGAQRWAGGSGAAAGPRRHGAARPGDIPPDHTPGPPLPPERLPVSPHRQRRKDKLLVKGQPASGTYQRNPPAVQGTALSLFRAAQGSVQAPRKGVRLLTYFVPEHASTVWVSHLDARPVVCRS